MIRHLFVRHPSLLVAVVVGLLLVPSALAFWTGTGTGSTTTTLDNPHPVTFGPGTPDEQLYPGGRADVNLVISNSNPVALHIASLDLDTDRGTAGFDVDSSHSACDVSVLTMTGSDNGGAGWTVPPIVGSTDGTLTVSLDHAIKMAPDAADACQSATFTVNLVAGA